MRRLCERLKIFHYYTTFKLTGGDQLLCNGPICVDFLYHFHLRLDYTKTCWIYFNVNFNIVENVLLGISPVSNYSWPTFRNPVSVPSSKAGGRLWGVRGSKV